MSIIVVDEAKNSGSSIHIVYNIRIYYCLLLIFQSSQSALGPRGNYGPSPLIPRGGLCPAVGRI
ncbi:hypothetical protein CHREV_273 [Choristoneura rosaceana entomopoxvirus 'L']|uniref:Uncharacterized protein n=1 Tax=Choristoneura rosaceana entomopoxvirus 'L' TaxID=1293539 RepID=A0ABM9QKX1_9POXV|nr:hypothetical protein CHREV_273 [Choristoneura rosaceana entomopoxvirus 'L']CCU56175.1 hypothetical protein CHREV_273 [Choristoneura rosaceana entomopoxvirus 'L']